MPKPRAEPRPSPRNHKTSRQSKRPPAGRSGDPGADHSITGSAVPVAGAGARTADRASIEAPANVIFHRIGGRLSWRPLSFQTKRTMSLIGSAPRRRETLVEEDLTRDSAARRLLARAFPKRKIIMLRIDAIADGGGGIRCLTQAMPAI
jgi:hypothetical protein